MRTSSTVEADEEEKIPGMDLTLPMTISKLIAIRSRIIQTWIDYNAASKSVDSAFAQIRDNDFNFLLETNGRSQHELYEVVRMTQALDYSLFVFALHKLNITQAMTGNAKDAFLEKIKKSKTVFDEKQLQGLAQNAAKLFKESSLNTVRDVYRQLIGCSYRSNDVKIDRKKDNLQKVEKVFRMGSSDIELETNWKGGHRIALRGWRYPASSLFHFNDLLTACRLIEGEGFTDYSNNFDSIIRDKADRGHDIDCGYFNVEAYHNGNVKVRWREEKIHVLEKLNAIGSGRENDLPDVQRKRYKAEHFADGGMPQAEKYFGDGSEIEPSDEKDFAFFPTPSDVALRMVELGECFENPDLEILEPSAGDGAIMSALHWRPGSSAIEFNHHRYLKLVREFPSWYIWEGDFLKWKSEQQYNRVIMNPPFNDRAEAFHIVKAFGHLKPGGILVAILPEGWFTRTDIKSTVLRAFLQKYEHKPSEKLSAGTFGRTQIQTRIVVLRKPIESANIEG